MEEFIHPQYLKGFNDAYILVQHRPDLMEQIANTTSNTTYLEGLKDGKRTYEQERTQQQRLQDLQNSHSKDDELER